MKNYYSLLAALLLGFSGWAQELPEELSKAIDLSRKFPYESVVATTAQTTYRFDKKEGLTATEEQEEVLISLREDYSFSKFASTNNESEIVEAKYFHGKKLSTQRSWGTETCASNLSSTIFDTDQKICEYELPLEDVSTIKKYTITKKYADVKYLTRAWVLEEHPVEEKVLRFEVPEWLEVQFVELNFEQYQVEKNVTEAESGMRIHEYRFKDLPAAYDEGASPGATYYEPHIALVFKSYTNNGAKETLFASINDQYQWYRELVSQVQVDTEPLKPLVAELTAGKTDDAAKIRAIFYWVQDNIRYIAFERGIMGFRPEAPQTVCAKRFGDCKGMANLTKEMLKLAGYDARLAWIGTNHLSPDYNYHFPSLANDNHMICALKIDGKFQFLDATETWVAYGDCAARIQGRSVMIEDGEDYLIETIKEQAASANRREDKMLIQLVDGQLVGAVKSKSFGEEKRYLMQQYDQIRSENKKEAMLQLLENKSVDISVTEHKVKGLENRDEATSFKYKFTVNEPLLKSGREVFINLNFDRDYEAFFIGEEREQAIDLGYNAEIISELTFEVPPNHQLNHVPEGFSYSNAWMFIQVEYEVVGSTLVYTKHITIEKRIIEPEDFEAWNEAMRGLKNMYNQYIIIKNVV